MSLHNIFMQDFALMVLDLKKDLIDAVKYFKLAADKGNLEASFLYCMMVFKGNWVPKNEEEGKKISFNQSFWQWRSIL